MILSDLTKCKGYFLSAVPKYLTGSNMRKEGLILADCSENAVHHGKAGMVTRGSHSYAAIVKT